MTNKIKTPPRQRTLLVILDGYGINKSKINNAIAAANTPKLDNYFNTYPHATLEASGRAVGLPKNQMGNSEVGHLTMGSGAIMRQDLVRIDDSILDGSFYKNAVFIDAISLAKKNNRPINIVGLVSEGGVHSHISHLCALLEMCHKHQVKPLLHMITDGRDTPPKSAFSCLDLLEKKIEKANGAVATVTGRYFAMDRDKRWDRTENAWNAIMKGQGRQANSLREAIQSAYDAGETDEFIQPTVIGEASPIQADDAMIFFNFRKDRTRQLTAAMSKSDFTDFSRGSVSPITVHCMTNYDHYFNQPYAFNEVYPETTLAETIQYAGLNQFHCAETEKYAHVTYFFNGGKGEAFPDEDRHIVPSPNVSTYDKSPEMSAKEVADTVIESLRGQQHSFIVVNFANGDMVGHTAIRDAVIKSIEALDREVGRVIDAAVEEKFSVIVTADHGNCEVLVDPVTGEPHTQHTTNLVPCLIIDQISWNLVPSGGLIDIAPTVLQLMGIPKPGSMTGHSLLHTPFDSKTGPNSEAAA